MEHPGDNGNWWFIGIFILFVIFFLWVVAYS